MRSQYISHTYKVAQDAMPEPFMQVAILDTNFLISNLAYLRTLTSQAAKYHGSLVLVVPWIVVKELDGLKVLCNNNDTSDSIVVDDQSQ